MYNYSHNVDYLDKEIEEKYQSDFLSVWNLKTYDNDIIMKKMENFYNNIKTVPFVLFLLDTIKSNSNDNLLIQLLQRDTTDNFSLFILLFNYENFQLFHNCLKEWKLYATPTEETFDKLIKNLKNNK